MNAAKFQWWCGELVSARLEGSERKCSGAVQQVFMRDAVSRWEDATCLGGYLKKEPMRLLEHCGSSRFQ